MKNLFDSLVEVLTADEPIPGATFETLRSIDGPEAIIIRLGVSDAYLLTVQRFA